MMYFRDCSFVLEYTRKDQNLFSINIIKNTNSVDTAVDRTYHMPIKTVKKYSKKIFVAAISIPVKVYFKN